MTLSKQSRDFLDKELLVKHNIVTFRSFSRQLGTHVNDAKHELQLYYDAVRDTDTPAVPTYLVSGEVPALKIDRLTESQQSDSMMDMDVDFNEDREEEDVVHQTKVLLVDARSLEDAMSQFSRIHSVHIYSLSPSRFGDAGLVCVPTTDVHKADLEGGLASFAVTGKITGSHVKLKSGVVYPRSAASSSKTTLDTVKAAPKREAEQHAAKSKAPLDVKENPSSTPKTDTKDKPKLSGKLDWSKAKTKGKESAAEKKEEKKPKAEPGSTTKDALTSKGTGLGRKPSQVVKPQLVGMASADARKRGVKRKPKVDTDPESDSEAFSVKAEPSFVSSSIKKEVTDSDDDDGTVRMLGLRRTKRKSNVTSDSEMSLRAMMDIDDDLVDRASRLNKARAQREEEEESSEEAEATDKAATVPETSEEDESDHAPIVQKKRKPRKVVPIGRNGLKKKRVVKSRTTTDAKGYMQTEDYSSYESVEEEEKEEEKPKGKGKTSKKAMEPEPKTVAREESTVKSKAKPAPKRGAPKRGGLLNFFGPGKK